MSDASPGPIGSDTRPVYTRATIIGLLLIALAAIPHIVVGLMAEDESLWFSNIIALVLTLLLSGLLLKYGSWALIVAAIVGLAAPLVFAPIVFQYGLGYPDSFFDFVPALLHVFGGLLALVGGITAFVQGRRGDPRTVATGVELGVLRGIGVVLVALVILSGILSLTIRDSVSAADKAGAIPVEMVNTQFEPQLLEAPASRAFQVVVKNSDLIIHTFSIDELDVNVALGGRSERLADIPSIPAGTYEYTCKVPGHEDMKGTLEVK